MEPRYLDIDRLIEDRRIEIQRLVGEIRLLESLKASKCKIVQEPSEPSEPTPPPADPGGGAPR